MFDRATEPTGTTEPVETDPVEKARALAWRALNKRDRTVDEVGGMLLGKRVEPSVADQVVTELIELGYLDDARYAQRFAEDRRTIDAWGAERIERRLLALGVDPALIAAALDARGAGEELEAALAVLRRRFARPPADDRSRDRALGLLVRKGYELELAYDAVRAFERDAA
jgi:regulatory protein